MISTETFLSKNGTSNQSRDSLCHSFKRNYFKKARQSCSIWACFSLFFYQFLITVFIIRCFWFTLQARIFTFFTVRWICVNYFVVLAIFRMEQIFFRLQPRWKLKTTLFSFADSVVVTDYYSITLLHNSKIRPEKFKTSIILSIVASMFPCMVFIPELWRQFTTLKLIKEYYIT